MEETCGRGHYFGTWLELFSWKDMLYAGEGTLDGL